MVCARGMLATGRAAYRRRGSSNEESLRNSAVWFCGLSCHQRTTRPPAFGYPAKDQAKAGGRVCRVMSMLVLDKLHYREIGSCAHVALPASLAYRADGKFFLVLIRVTSLHHGAMVLLN